MSKIMLWTDSTPTNDWDGGDCEDENCHGLDGVLQNLCNLLSRNLH